jgi:hypothetical protein
MDIDQRLEKLTERHEAQVIESVDSLARIAHAHENRITHLEDGRQ